MSSAATPAFKQLGFLRTELSRIMASLNFCLFLSFALEWRSKSDNSLAAYFEKKLFHNEDYKEQSV